MQRIVDAYQRRGCRRIPEARGTPNILHTDIHVRSPTFTHRTSSITSTHHTLPARPQASLLSSPLGAAPWHRGCREPPLLTRLTPAHAPTCACTSIDTSPSRTRAHPRRHSHPGTSSTPARMRALLLTLAMAACGCEAQQQQLNNLLRERAAFVRVTTLIPLWVARGRAA